MEVAGFFVPILSVLATLLKSRFFVIYYICVTLADGMGRWRDQGPALRFSILRCRRAGVYSRRKICYIIANESEEALW